MPRNGHDNTEQLRTEIRKQFGSAGTMRFARSLPVFEVERDVPERFANLLAELERTESAARSGE